MRTQVVAVEKGITLIRSAREANMDVRAPLVIRLDEETLAPVLLGTVRPGRPVVARDDELLETRLQQRLRIVEISDRDLDVHRVLRVEPRHGRRSEERRVGKGSRAGGAPCQ